MPRATPRDRLREELKEQAALAGAVARALGVLRQAIGAPDEEDASQRALIGRLSGLLHEELATLDETRIQILDAVLPEDRDELSDELDVDIAFAIDPVLAEGE